MKRLFSQKWFQLTSAFALPRYWHSFSISRAVDDHSIGLLSLKEG
jgi:hypothetical protein